jgi:hypothetical protein
MPEPDPSTSAALQRLGRVWRDRVDGPVRKAAVAVAVLALFLLAHLARIGTGTARLVAATILVGLLAAYLVRWMMSRRGWRDPRWVVTQTIVATDPDLGHRALRAMRLADRTARDPSSGSEGLARVHLERTLSRARPENVDAKASRIGRFFSQAALAAGALGIVAIAIGPFRVIEGLDVLFARHGFAPVPFQWLDEVGMISHPPEYLHQRDVAPDDLTRAALPYGSLLTFRGVPLHSGRRLVLVDGATEVPFVDDATGGVVARWPLTTSAKLRVAARFGSVLIPEPYVLSIASIPDEAPAVTLQGAPKTIKLIDTPEIEISYDALDDHGLREVHLVLRSGGREERRVLARLDGETKHDRGGYRLRANDRFLKRSFAPIEISVEARDNDPLNGPKWGKSAAITAIPPIVGEPEAMRFEALAHARDSFVDLMAFRIESDVDKADAGQLRAHALSETEETNRAIDVLDRSVSDSYGGLTVPRRAKTLAGGQLRKLRDLLAQETRRTNKDTHAANVKASEDVSLALDGALRRLDVADSVSIAKRLADVADDAAEGAAEARRPADREHGTTRFDTSSSILDGGGASLVRLGTLGHDLGEIVANDLKRARRARGAPDKGEDFFHAELALRDLAARLRHPSPSFSGGARSGGVEAGGNGSPDDGDPEGDQQIAREQEEIEELARDHAGEVSGVEQALNAAESGEELDKLREEAKQHAQAVRDAVRSLPRSGSEPGSADSAGAAAREQAEAMADEVDRGGIADAVKSGRNAVGSLDQAQHGQPDRFSFRKDIREDAKNAAGKLDPEVKWAERALDRLRESAAARAGDELKKTSPRENKLADRARSIANEGSNGPGALPGDALDLLQGAEEAMRDGARSLESAEGSRALERLKEAQRLLEMARSGNDSDEGEEGPETGKSSNRGDHEGENGDFAHHAPIPKAEDYKGPEAFRRRVLEGLGSSSDPRLRDAVKRYADGLLR